MASDNAASPSYERDMPEHQPSSRGLRAKIGIAFILQAAAISCATILGIYAAAAVLEDVLIKRALREEAAHFLKRRADNPAHPIPDTHNMSGFLLPGNESTDILPFFLQDLTPGFHNIRLPDQRPLVYVEEGPHGRLYLLFDQQHVGQLAFFFGLLPLAMVLLFIYLTSFFAYRLSRRAISPVIWLAGEVRRWDPKAPNLAALAPESLPPDLEGESQILADALYNLGKRIQSHIERERTFTRDASHELRSPLTVIKIATDVILAEDDVDPYIRRNVVRIQRSSRDMESLIEAFLILARDADTGLPAEDFLINTVVREEMERAEPLICEKPVQLTLVEEARLMLNAPAKVVGVLLGNLIRNACIYTDHGEVRVIIGYDAVRIEDTGCGMSEEELERVFQPFFRAGNNNRSGHGVGLAIVRRLSERFAWPVEMQSRVGVGTTAVVRFPQAQGESTATAPASAPATRGVSPQLA